METDQEHKLLSLASVLYQIVATAECLRNWANTQQRRRKLTSASAMLLGRQNDVSPGDAPLYQATSANLLRLSHLR